MRRSFAAKRRGERSYSCGGSAGFAPFNLAGTGFPHDGPADHSGETHAFPSLSGHAALRCDRPRKCRALVLPFSRKVRRLARSSEKFQTTHPDMKGASFGSLESGARSAQILFTAASNPCPRIDWRSGAAFLGEAANKPWR